MIRKAEIEDVPSIIEVARKSWDVTYKEILSQEQFDYMLNKFYAKDVILKPITEGTQHYLVYMHNNEVAGFVSYELKEEYCKIHKLYLLPEAKGLGMGKKLVNAVKDIAQAKKLSSVQLNVNKYNTALDFYKKIGMEVLRAEVIDIGEGYVMDDYVMSLQIQ